MSRKLRILSINLAGGFGPLPFQPCESMAAMAMTPTREATMYKTITFKTAKDICQVYGCTLRKNDGEYRVNFSYGREETAYYTNDIEDAVATSVIMAKRN
jgi:hypothetical protein